MTKILTIIGLAALLAGMSAKAQTVVTETNASGGITTITNPATSEFNELPAGVQTGFNYLAANTNALMATNWTGYAAYTRVSGTGAVSKNGGTIGLNYYINPYVGTQIRLQYINTGKTKWFLPNGTVTLQSAYKPFASLPITLRPLLEAGVASDFSGNLYAIAGTGSELDLWVSANRNTVVQRVSVFYGIERWEGQGDNLTLQQFGAAVNLNLASALGKINGLITSL